MNTLQLSLNNPVSNSNRQALGKFLLFQVGQLNLALSVDRVKKIINHTPVFGSGLSDFGVVHLDDQEMTVIDLHRRFLKTSERITTNQKGYLILSKTLMGEIFALWVAQTPTLIDVSIKQIRVLPESYRRRDTLDAASHVMLLPEENGTKTVFLLDVEQLVSLNAHA